MSDESREEVIYNAFDAYLNIGRHLIKRRAYARALLYLDEAQKLEETNVTCMLLRGTCYLYLTKLEQALEEGRKAHERKKKNPHAVLLMAEAYYRKGEFEEALTLFERGKRMRPSITAFQIGVYKCEQAIENNCGMDCNLELGPDVDLTAYYLHAFPPKVTRKAPEKKMGSKVVSVSKKAEKWPIDMPPEILNTLFGKAYPEYVYLRQLYEVEGKREKFLKQTGITLMPTVLPRIQRCEDNRKDVMACANCLNRKCDLWYKMDPSMKHDSRLM